MVGVNLLQKPKQQVHLSQVYIPYINVTNTTFVYSLVYIWCCQLVGCLRVTNPTIVQSFSVCCFWKLFHASLLKLVSSLAWTNILNMNPNSHCESNTQLGRSCLWCTLYWPFIYDVPQSDSEGGMSILHQDNPKCQLNEVWTVYVYITFATFFLFIGFWISRTVYKVQSFPLIGHPYYKIRSNFSIPAWGDRSTNNWGDNICNSMLAIG